MATRFRTFIRQIDVLPEIVREKLEPLHLYCLAAALAVALIEAFSPPQYSNILKLAVLFVLAGLVISTLFQKADILPSPEDVSVVKEFEIVIPCIWADLEDAISIAEYYFGEDTMRRPTVRQNRKLTPYSFVIAKNAEGKVVGFLDLFCFSPKALSALINGEITEPELNERDLSAASGISDFYIGGFAVHHNMTKAERCKIATALLYAMLIMLRKFYLHTRPSINLYSIAYTKQGLHWLERMRFRLELAAGHNRNKFPVYKTTVDERSVEEQLPKYRVAKHYAKIKFE